MRTLILSVAFACVPLMLSSAAHAERHYDCSKPGNANKAACKAAGAAPAAPASSAAAPTPAGVTTASDRHYDCSKAGNANKAACKTASAVAPPTTTATASAAKPSIFSRMTRRAQPAAPATSVPTATAASAPGGSYVGKSITTNPAGATGQCKDGTFTHATHHSGACSSHGGVAKWM